eukprot:gene31130-6267_t
MAIEEEAASKPAYGFERFLSAASERFLSWLPLMQLSAESLSQLSAESISQALSNVVWAYATARTSGEVDG